MVWCAIGLCAGLYLFLNGFRVLQRRHLILNTPVSKIRSASMGVVELSGLAVGPYTVIAPVTERQCYYFRSLVWEWKRRGRSKQWVKVAAECMHVPFFLDDNTGKVMIDPRGAELDLHRDFRQEYCDSFFTSPEEVPPNVRALLSRHGVDTSNKIKVEEFCIKPKNALFVLGTLGENPGIELNPQPIQDDENNTLTFGKSLCLNPAQSDLGGKVWSLASAGSDDAPSKQRSVSELLMGAISYGKSEVGESNFQTSASYDKTLSDFTRQIRLSPDPPAAKTATTRDEQKMAAILMAAGISNPAALAAAGVTPSALAVQANNPAHEKPGADGGFDAHPSVVLKKGKNIPILLISWRSQREIARSLGWKSGLMIWGGPALTLLCLYGLLALRHGI